MPVINQMAYSGQDTDTVSKSFSLHFWVRSKAVNRHATGRDLASSRVSLRFAYAWGSTKTFPVMDSFRE